MNTPNRKAKAVNERSQEERVIGLGSGRCGTNTLAQLLDACFGHQCQHEPGPALPWDIDEQKLERHLNLEKSAIALFYGRYWQYFDDVKFIVLKRNKRDTIESFVECNPLRNHWNDNNWSLWDYCYPSYGDVTKEEGVSRYYDEYYEMMPEDALWIRTEDLSDEEKQRKIFAYAGIPEENMVFQDIVANTREEHLGVKHPKL